MMTYLEESDPEDRLVRWLSSFRDEALDWPTPSEDELPIRSNEEAEEAQPARRRKHRGRSRRRVRERREAALLRRWRSSQTPALSILAAWLVGAMRLNKCIDPVDRVFDSLILSLVKPMRLELFTVITNLIILRCTSFIN